MTAAAELAQGVRLAIRDQPYTLVDETPDGFSLHVDVVDARWWSLLKRHRLKQTWRWDVRVGDGTYAVTDVRATLAWEAGLDVAAGVPRPALRFGASYFAGTTVSLSRQTVWAWTDDGRLDRVVDYTFDSREGAAIIDAVAQRQGLRKKLGTQARIGLFFAVLALGGLVVCGLVALVLLLTGHLT
ncbi:MAG: hypothetical protein Q7T56_09690 [Nocardioidaceae bacterium]|nr:hypothetical protein [Nocardioidaceae bacterium]